MSSSSATLIWFCMCVSAVYPQVTSSVASCTAHINGVNPSKFRQTVDAPECLKIFHHINDHNFAFSRSLTAIFNQKFGDFHMPFTTGIVQRIISFISPTISRQQANTSSNNVKSTLEHRGLLCRSWTQRATANRKPLLLLHLQSTFRTSILFAREARWMGRSYQAA